MGTCPRCGARSVVVDEYNPDYSDCVTCGLVLLTSDLYQGEEATVQEQDKCPHCGEPIEEPTWGEAVWCPNCGLDYSAKEISTPDLALLANYDSWLHKIMEKDPDRLRPGTPMGEFLRQKCLMKCPYSEYCEQGWPAFKKCYSSGEPVKPAGFVEEQNREERSSRGTTRSVVPVTAVGLTEAVSSTLVIASKGGWFESKVGEKTGKSKHAEA